MPPKRSYRLQLASAFGMRVIGVDERRSEKPPGVVELHRGRDCLVCIFVLFKKHKHRFTHRDLVAVAQPSLRHCTSVYEGSITAFKVTNLVIVVLAAEHTVASRQGEIADGKRIGWIPPNPDLGLGQKIGRIGQGSRRNLESGFHSFAPRSCTPFNTISGLSSGS